MREHEDLALAHVGGDLSGSVVAMLPSQGPAFGPLPPKRVSPGSDTLLPPAAVTGSDPFIADLFSGLSSPSDIRDVAREALLSGCLATHVVMSLSSGAAVQEATLRWLFAIATSRHSDGEAARSAGAVILTACETAFAARGVPCPPHVEAAITCARLYVTPHRRHGNTTHKNGAPVLTWAPSATDFLTALAAVGVLGLSASEEAGQQQHGDVDMADAMDDDLPPGFTAPPAPASRQQPAGAAVVAPAPMPLNVPLILALLAPCLAIRAASGMADPDAGTAAQLLLALARLSVDPTACDVAREPIRHAMAAITNALSPKDWAAALQATAVQLAQLPPSAAATAAALHCMPLASSRCRRLRAFAALVTLQHMPCCAAKSAPHGDKAPTTAEAAAGCVAVLQDAPLTPGVTMPVVDYAGLCAALRLGNAAMEALVAHGGESGVGSGSDSGNWAEATDADDSPASAAAALPGILDAWRAALQQVAKKVRPSALNLAAVSANGEAARLLARYGKRAANAQADGEGGGKHSLGVASLGDDDDV